MVLRADGAGVFVPGVQLQADKAAAKGAKAGAKSAEKAAAKKEKTPAKAAAKRGRPKKVRVLVRGERVPGFGCQPRAGAAPSTDNHTLGRSLAHAPLRRCRM